ncbi:TPA: ABC transporter permease [Candidatus Bathyarchaeota archaeon]|nr:ABC transporter permease [Candidatus Bathyarchaeota archaeon]
MVSLRAYVVTRVLLTVPTILILLSIVFLIMRVMPGDPVYAWLGPKARPEYAEALKRKLGLDKPIYLQFIDYLWQLCHGDLGRSLIWGKRPVIVEIWEHFPATVELSIFSFTISVLIGLFTGALSAHRYRTMVDHTLRLYGIVTYALFIPWFGMILQMSFGVYLGWLPVAGRIDVLMEPATVTGLYVLDSILTLNLLSLVSSLRHLALPSITLGIYLSGIFTRTTRVNMLDVLRQDYIRAARARGLPERIVVYKHALKNAFLPILTMMGLQFALLLAGAVLTETTFSWPGVGTFLVERILYRDFTTVQGTIVFFAVLITAVSLIVDIIYAYIDPRIRF